MHVCSLDCNLIVYLITVFLNKSDQDSLGRSTKGLGIQQEDLN